MAIWKATVHPLSGETARTSLQLVLRGGQLSGEWAEQVGFRPEGVYEIRSSLMKPVMVAWRSDQERTYLVAYLVNGAPLNFDIVSMLQGDGALTTGTTGDGHLLPVGPDTYMQTFDAPQVETLWRRHREGLDYLASTKNRRVETAPGDLVEDFLSSLRSQAAHVRSIPLWGLRIPFWYLTRRTSRHNKSLEQLGV
ncbi:hypothetical protein MalM25_04070 [Planctomycetes bacterium MalM25]|nr:hypothetical protein MalM25_04070 [Planctomycetes bacterium MalM25]